MSDTPNYTATLLKINGEDVNPYASRGLTQTLAPIAQAAFMRRTINGARKDLSAPQFRKYVSQITCQDQLPPCLDGVMPGTILTIDCAAHLTRKDDEMPMREVVAGSEISEAGFIRYRPRLQMMVSNLSTSEDEYGAITSWSLELEEV